MAKAVSHQIRTKVVEAPSWESEGPTDEELVQRILTGDQWAFREFSERYRLRAYRLAYGMTGQREAAEDLTQEIFLRAYQKLHSYRGGSSFSTWFYRLAVNRCLNYRQREQVTTEEALAGDERMTRPIGQLEPMEARVLQRQISRQVHRAILSLKPKWRLIVILKEIEGLSYAEIAERTGCSEGTVASRLNRARALLARKLNHLQGQWH